MRDHDRCGIASRRFDNAVEGYRQARLTLREAAERAGVSPREMMDELARSGVELGDLRATVREQVRGMGRR